MSRGIAMLLASFVLCITGAQASISTEPTIIRKPLSVKSASWVANALKLAKFIEQNELIVTEEDWVALEARAFAATGSEKLRILRKLTRAKALSMELEEYKRFNKAYLMEIDLQDAASHKRNADLYASFVRITAEGNADLALKEIETALVDTHLTDDQRVDAYTLLSYLSADSSKTERAIQYIGMARQIARNDKVDLDAQIELSSAEAYVSISASDYITAVDAIWNNYDLMRQVDWPFDGAVAVYNVAAMMTQVEAHAEATQAANIYLALAKKMGTQFDINYGWLLCILTAEGREDYARVAECGFEIEPYLDEYQELKLETLLAIANALAHEGRAIGARAYVEKVRADERFYTDQSANEYIGYVEAEVLAAEGRFAEAFKKLNAYQKRDSKKREQQIQDIVEELRKVTATEAESLKERASLLNEQAVLQQSVIRRQRQISALSFVTIVFVLLLVLLQIRANRSLAKAKNAALSANKAKSEFLANMSHEIRTPMNGVLGMAELLQSSQLSAKQEVYVETIFKSGSALVTIINDILDFSKIEAGKIELDPAPFDLRSAVDDVAALLVNGAREKNIELIVRCHPGVPDMLEGDGGRIRQILTNLIGNAIKFTHEGYVLVDVNAEIDDSNAQITISVEDTGIGIPEDKVEHVFEQFTQAEGSTTRKYGGTGLGLCITQSLVEAMNGSIVAQSELDKGSTFTVSLTLPIEKASKVSPQKYCAVSGIDVLIVDDLSINRQILTEQLSSWGMRPACADSGKMALDMLKRAAEKGKPFPVAILDYHMPEMDGAELARRIKSDDALNDLGILVLSSVDDEQSLSAFRTLGIEEILAKPARSVLILQAIGRMLADSSLSTLKTIVDSEVKKDLEKPSATKSLEGSASVAKVLVVEDNEVNRMVIEKMIDPALATLEFATDGAIGYEKYRQASYDLVLMDISMPNMDGVEATKAIRSFEVGKNKRRTPIVALTAHAMPGDKTKFFEAGMDDYLTKPVRKNAVCEVIKKWAPGKATDAA